MGSFLACSHDLAANTNHPPRMWRCRVWLLARGHYRRKIRRTRFRLPHRQSLKHPLLDHPCGENLALVAGGELHRKLQPINHRICRSESRAALRVTNRDSNLSPPNPTRCLRLGYLHLLLGAVLLAQAQVLLKAEPDHRSILGVANPPPQRLQVTQRLKSQVSVNLEEVLEYVPCRGMQTRLIARRHRSPRPS